jgi:hypothetical protein
MTRLMFSVKVSFRIGPLARVRIRFRLIVIVKVICRIMTEFE